jgi:hypothetical protein
LRYERLAGWSHAGDLDNHFAVLGPCEISRLHKTLRVTPAMAAGVSDRLWEMGDVVKLLEDFEAKRIESNRLTAITPEGACGPRSLWW